MWTQLPEKVVIFPSWCSMINGGHFKQGNNSEIIHLIRNTAPAICVYTMLAAILSWGVHFKPSVFIQDFHLSRRKVSPVHFPLSLIYNFLRVGIIDPVKYCRIAELLRRAKVSSKYLSGICQTYDHGGDKEVTPVKAVLRVREEGTVEV